MKTKEEAFIEFIDNDKIPRIPKIWFSKGWDAATQQLEAQREKHVKTNIQILSKATGLSIEELEFKNEVQCIRPSEALEAMEAATANHDKEMMEFAEWAGIYYVRLNDCWVHRYTDQRNSENWHKTSDLLTKFRQSK